MSRQAQRSAGTAFVVLMAPSSASPPRARLGLTVSRRVGSAVVRNRVKRQVREWFRREGVVLAGDADVVVIARAAAAHLRGPEAAAELRRLCRKARP
jgi:ribonuclease P protein component